MSRRRRWCAAVLWVLAVNKLQNLLQLLPVLQPFRWRIQEHHLVCRGSCTAMHFVTDAPPWCKPNPSCNTRALLHAGMQISQACMRVLIMRSPVEIFRLYTRLCRAAIESWPRSAADARDTILTRCLARALTRSGTPAGAKLHGPATNAVMCAAPTAFGTSCMTAWRLCNNHCEQQSAGSYRPEVLQQQASPRLHTSPVRALQPCHAIHGQAS